MGLSVGVFTLAILASSSVFAHSTDTDRHYKTKHAHHHYDHRSARSAYDRHSAYKRYQMKKLWRTKHLYYRLYGYKHPTFWFEEPRHGSKHAKKYEKHGKHGKKHHKQHRDHRKHGYNASERDPRYDRDGRRSRH
jgi:hypothetical protein